MGKGGADPTHLGPLWGLPHGEAEAALTALQRRRLCSLTVQVSGVDEWAVLQVVNTHHLPLLKTLPHVTEQAPHSPVTHLGKTTSDYRQFIMYRASAAKFTQDSWPNHFFYSFMIVNCNTVHGCLWQNVNTVVSSTVVDNVGYMFESLDWISAILAFFLFLFFLNEWPQRKTEVLDPHWALWVITFKKLLEAHFKTK